MAATSKLSLHPFCLVPSRRGALLGAAEQRRKTGLPRLGPARLEHHGLPRAGVSKRQAAGMQSDGRPQSGCCRERQPRAIRSVSDDRAAPACQLHPQLVSPAGRGHELDERHLAQAFHHSGTNMALTAGHIVFIAAIAGIVVSVISRDATARTASGPQSRPPLLALALDQVVPIAAGNRPSTTAT